MKFDAPATTNAIDQLRIVGKPVDRIDGPLKTTGRAPYAYERHDVAPDAAYGYVLGAAIAKGRIRSIDLSAARSAPGVLAIVTAENAGRLGKGDFNTAKLLGGPRVEHYHQAIALVVARSFEEARAAAQLVQVDYAPARGHFDLREAVAASVRPDNIFGDPTDTRIGDFDTAHRDAPVQLDELYTTPDQSHAAMEPHASIATWEDDRLTLWTSNQSIGWGVRDVAKTLGIPQANVRLSSPFVGGGFGGKMFVRADAILAALGARAAGRPVKVALPRPLIVNNTTHRPATLQRIRIGADRDGRITAIGHESWSGDLPGGQPEPAALPTRLLYAGANRMTAVRLAVLDLPEGNAMRAPGDASGLMALEIAMDEMAEKLGMDPVAFRLLNDTLVDPEQPELRFSQRNLAQCLRIGAARFGWSQREARPAMRREGGCYIGMGMAAGMRSHLQMRSAARVRLDRNGGITVMTDMTDIGTGSYTIIAQTAAETMGVSLDKVSVQLGDSRFPTSCGSGGQWGASNATSGVYAACMRLRATITEKLGLNQHDVEFLEAGVRSGTRLIPLAQAAAEGDLIAEDGIEYADFGSRTRQATFAAHFVEVSVDAATGETRVRRMLAVCAAGRILNPKSARSQVIGAMTMGVGAALMEKLDVESRAGFFVNHDLAGYEIPIHADIPQQDVVFLDEEDPTASPMKAKGVGELGLCGTAAALANAVYNATGVRVRDYPITLDKLIMQLPPAE